MRLLVIEDEEDLLHAIAKGLRKNGYLVDTATDGVDGLALAHLNAYDLVILDLNLPQLDGLEVLKEIRQNDQTMRVLILSARATVPQRITGLDLGANDYMVKPFDFLELLARVRSLLRRTFLQNNVAIPFWGLCFDTHARRLTAEGGEPIELAPKELLILEYLVLNRARPVSPSELISHAWDEEDSLFSNALKVHISTLRKKLLAYTGSDIITWVRGSGYMIREEES